MKPFFLYFFTGTATLYPLLHSLGFASDVQSTFAMAIAIGFTVLYLLAANISLFVKKEAAVLGLITFSLSLAWIGYLLVKGLLSGNLFQWSVMLNAVLCFFTSYVVLYSFRSVFINQELKWGSKNNMLTILKLILIGIQIIIISVILQN